MTTSKTLVQLSGDRLTVELERASAPSLLPGDRYRPHAYAEDGLALVLSEWPSFFCGSLRALSLGDIFGHLLAGLRTGKLVVTAGAIKKSVHFIDGQIVFATSTERHERLGNALIQLGLLSRDQLDQALLEVGARARLGQVLTRSGLVSAGNLYSAMTFLVREITLNLFELSEGEFLFAEGEIAKDALRLPERTRQVVLEGMKRGDEVVRLRHRLPAQQRVKLAPHKIPGATDALWASLVRGASLEELRPRYEGSEHAFLSWAEQQLAAGDWIKLEAAAAPRPRPDAASQIGPLERYSALIAGMVQALKKAGDDLTLLHHFGEHAPPGLSAAFRGVGFADDGQVDMKQLVGNLSGAGAAVDRARVLEALHSFVAYVLFSAKNVLPAEETDRWEHEFRRMREGR